MKVVCAYLKSWKTEIQTETMQASPLPKRAHLKMLMYLVIFFFCAWVLSVISIMLQMEASRLLLVPRLACYHKHVLRYYTVHHPCVKQLQTSPLIDCWPFHSC